MIEVGVLYSTGNNLTNGASGVTKQVLTPDNSGSVSFEAEGLQFATTYNYCYYVCQNGKYSYGHTQTFTTADFPWDSAEDLSINGTANCYIVSESGFYKIKAVKGSGATPVGAVKTAKALWESFGTSVTPSIGDLVQYVSRRDNYIGFKIHDDFKKGNAVIAAKDDSGNILWSWHIWLTDQPQEHVYNNNAGTMMDRNLGAISATPGDVGALGLLYQWGRKDPFLGSSSISSSTLAKSTITWPSAVSSNSSNGTIAYATAHPTTFITYYSNKHYDWFYTIWSITDNTRWTTSDEGKSIYDPCPAGWRVPDGGDSGVWSKALGSSSYFDHAYNKTSNGMNFSMFGAEQTIWYPASGYRGDGDGSLYGVGDDDGYYWAASTFGNDAHTLCFFDGGRVGPSHHNHRACGFPVRCQKE